MRLYVLVARITIETGSVESVCIICRMDVVTRVDRRFDSSTILRLSPPFMLTDCDGYIKSDSKSLSLSSTTDWNVVQGIVNRGDWLGSPANIKRANKDAKIYVGRSTTLHNLLFCPHTLCMNYVTNTFLLVGSSFRSKQLLCFVQGQSPKSEQKHTTKNFDEFHNHSPQLTIFKDVRFMTPLLPDELSKGEEQTMKDWLENYRPVRQRTVRCETTKDKAGTLPPAVYSNANPNATARVFFPADQVEETPTASSEMRPVVSDVSELSFVSDATVPQLTLASTADFSQVEKYESDSDASDNDADIESEELVIGKPIMSRSGRKSPGRGGT